MVIWLFGYLVIWLFGYLVIWLFGYLVIWLFGYLVIWLLISINFNTLKKQRIFMRCFFLRIQPTQLTLLTISTTAINILKQHLLHAYL